ncbi:enoyl-CoA hydratase/isomerase family protein [Parasphingorhabdus sp.]|uniref:enoyl-CoA hydratase/isomerase family protein n=1 Tax=Parasphingorhabdus sp. TaxID=2709688 RepID=UPI003A92B651
MVKTVELTIEDGLARLTLVNGDKGNPLDLEFGKQFKAAAIELHACSELRAVLFTAEGKNFSVGGNLLAFADVDDLPTFVRASTSEYHQALALMMRLNAPIVSAVQGAVAGAGVALSVFADLVVASEDANWTVAYTAIGFSPDGASTFLLPRLIGMRRFQEMLLTNRRIKAEEACEIGLVTEVVAASKLQERAITLAQQLAKGPTLAFAASRRLLLETNDNSLDTQLAREAELLSRICASDDVREGIAAALERRPAAFKGR